jgi:chromosome segregation and condensation protein ScpB
MIPFIICCIIITLLIIQILEAKKIIKERNEAVVELVETLVERKEINSEAVKQRQSDPENLLLTQCFYLQSCIKTNNNVEKQFKTIRETLDKLEHDYKSQN